MIVWNLALTAGLLGCIASALILVWFVVRLCLRQRTPASWIVGLAFLGFASLITLAGSQVTIVTKLSSSGTDDNESAEPVRHAASND